MTKPSVELTEDMVLDEPEVLRDGDTLYIRHGNKIYTFMGANAFVLEKANKLGRMEGLQEAYRIIQKHMADWKYGEPGINIALGAANEIRALMKKEEE